jgi:hypothetical protein
VLLTQEIKKHQPRIADVDEIIDVLFLSFKNFLLFQGPIAHNFLLNTNETVKNLRAKGGNCAQVAEDIVNSRYEEHYQYYIQASAVTTILISSSLEFENVADSVDFIHSNKLKLILTDIFRCWNKNNDSPYYKLKCDNSFGTNLDVSFELLKSQALSFGQIKGNLTLNETIDLLQRLAICE